MKKETNIDEVINKFKEHAIMHYKYTIDGDWKKGNVEIKKINSIYKSIKVYGIEAQKKLLELIYSEIPEVASLAATYSMTFCPDECLSILLKISERDIPHISTASKYAIQNWNNKEWYI
jgi:hypothetical protein